MGTMMEKALYELKINEELMHLIPPLRAAELELLEEKILDEGCRDPLVVWKETGELASYGEIYPSNIVPVIAPNRSGDRAVFPMKWGYTGKTLLINARVETAREKLTFMPCQGVKFSGQPYAL